MRVAIQAGLVILIAVLAFFLYRSITEPYQEKLELERQTQIGRERLDDVRSALIAYRDVYDTYPSTLDSLSIFVAQDTAFTPPELEEELGRITEFSGANDLQVSARNGEALNYQVVQETDSTGAPTGVEIYWLQDPGAPGDSIGARDPNPSFRNRESWI
ncbi:MAG TPA: hypothetical protein EYQ24_05355 [Bacteroidetes bacterium]|nr:hypothetical protein [Bacteroidota bacterium]